VIIFIVVACRVKLTKKYNRIDRRRRDLIWFANRTR